MAKVIWMTVASSCWLWNVWHYLHTTWNDARWATAAGSICGGCWPTESLRKLLKQCGANPVRSNVDGVSDTENNELTLCRKWQARLRSVQASTRLLLDFANTTTTLANNGTDQNVWDEETKRVLF
jgi:hypothetical protein